MNPTRLPPLARRPEHPDDALAPYEPGGDAPWDHRLAAHALRRIGFGGSKQEIEAVLAAGPAAAARALVDAPADAQLADLDDGIDTLLSFEDPRRLRAWWAMRMITTRAPARDKMALFWHGHFACAYRKVRSVRAMHGQVRAFIDGAFGSFRELARGIARDPAMLIFLDGAKSERLRPNENFARELMELFTLGRGNYTEADIREAARAFTGWRVDVDRAHFHAPSHDAGSKTVFGRSGAFKDGDVVDLCVDHPACAPYLSKRLLAYYVQPDPPAALVAAFAERIRAAKFAMAEPMKILFASRAFYAAEAFRSMIKSPVEFSVGALRALGGRAAGAAVGDAMNSMGQSLFDPPSVKGWDGGRAWHHSATWIARMNFAKQASTAGGPLEREFDAAEWFGGAAQSERAGVVLSQLLHSEAGADVAARLQALAESGASDDAACSALLHATMSLPEYQLS